MPRINLCLAKKYDIIQKLRNGVKQRSIASEYNITESTVSRIKQEQNTITARFETDAMNPKTKRCKKTELDGVDKALLQWFQTTAAGQAGVSGIVLLHKARDFAANLGLPTSVTDKIDKNWIQRWKARHEIVQQKLHGESSSVNPADVTKWHETLVQSLLVNYSLCDIYNLDEMGLFWRLLPNKTHNFKGVQCSGGKQANERITVLVGASATGEKLPLFVIGKSKMPRCFRNANISVMYEANKRAWMTSDLFEMYIRKIDRQMLREKRRVAIILDNCTAHPRLAGLHSVSLFFLPPNTTAVTQPMDAGVIANTKHWYRSEIVRRKILALDSNGDFTLNLLEAVRILLQSWEKVIADTIVNCFRHVGIVEVGSEDIADTNQSSIV